MGHRRASLAPLAVVVLLAGAVALGCTEKPETAVREPSGATAVTLTTEDGLALQARHWPADGERLAIYLHEYRSDQSAWWPYTRQVRSPGLSALTVDLRGHGESEGLPDDIEGMLADVRATLAFAREQGYRQVMLVGAGMGAALAISAAVDHPEVTVVGFSAPVDFDVLDPLAAAPHLRGRLSLVASREDLSAVYSLDQFREAAQLLPTQALRYPGRSHGVKMLSGRAGADVRAYFDRMLRTHWRSAD